MQYMDSEFFFFLFGRILYYYLAEVIHVYFDRYYWVSNFTVTERERPMGDARHKYKRPIVRAVADDVTGIGDLSIVGRNRRVAEETWETK